MKTCHWFSISKKLCQNNANRKVTYFHLVVKGMYDLFLSSCGNKFKKVTMNALFSFDLFMFYILECKQQLRTMKRCKQIPDIAHLNLGCSVIIIREACNTQLPTCDIA